MNPRFRRLPPCTTVSASHFRIFSGIYGYPKDEALHVATTTITEFLADHDMDVYLAVFDKTAFTVSKGLLDKVESCIDEHYT